MQISMTYTPSSVLDVHVQVKNPNLPNVSSYKLYHIVISTTMSGLLWIYADCKVSYLYFWLFKG